MSLLEQQQGSQRIFASAERGGVIVMFSVVVFVLLAFVGLVIDGGVLASSDTRYKNYTDYAALSAMKAYLNSTGESNLEKLDDAASRASEITGMNIAKFQSAGLLTDPSKSQNDVRGTGSSASGGANGKLIPGRWHQVQSAETPASCFVNGEFTPCFEELPTSALASAFRLELNLNKESNLKTFFGKFLGQDSTPIKASATVALIPRHGVFLVDLGRSITRQYHRDYSVSGSSRSEYAFDCVIEDNGPTSPFKSLPDNRPAGETSPWKKFEDDYSACTPSNGRNYRFDQFTDPEPLTSVLENVRNAMQFFVDRNIPGDKVSFAGIDNEILAQRKLELTAPDLTNAGPYKDFYDVFKRPTSSAEKDLKKNKFLFPRVVNSAGVNVFTDLRLALDDAYQDLATDPDFKSVENFVVLVTNGLSSCSTSATGIVSCANTQQEIQASISQLKQYLQDTYGPNNIVLHIIIADPKVGPHTLVRSAGQGQGCVTDGDSRDATPPLDVTDYIDTDSTNNWVVSPENFSSPARPIFYSNSLYSAVQELGGLWGPVRPCCRQDSDPVSGAPLPGCGDFSNQLATACNDQQSQADYQVGDVVTNGFSGIATYFGDQDNWFKMSGVDSKGRLMCDPNNRSEQQQIEEYFRTILDTSPMMLVE